MKRFVAVFLSMMMIFSSIAVNAEVLDFLRITSNNHTVEADLKFSFDNADEFFDGLTEIFGELSSDAPVDVKMLVESLFSSTSGTLVKTDISEDYKKIKAFMTTDAEIFADVNENLSATASVSSSMWIDMDISDVTNPKCKIVSYSPVNTKYVCFDLFELMFETMDDGEKMMVLAIMYSLLDEEFISKTSNYIVDCYEKYGDAVKEGNTVTVKFDNDGFLKLVDDLIVFVVDEFMEIFPMDQSVENDFSIPSIAETGLVVLGDNGVVSTFNLNENGDISCDTVVDFEISLKNIFDILGDEFPYEEDLVIELTVEANEKLFDIGTTVVELPELTKENSVSLEDVMYGDYYESDYPHYWVTVETAFVPDSEVLYVPFEEIMYGAYDEYAVVEKNDNLVTVTCEKFDEYNSITFEVGDTKAYLDGQEVTFDGQILEVDGVVYVSRKFLHKVLGWDITEMVYSIVDETYAIEIDTDPYLEDMEDYDDYDDYDDYEDYEDYEDEVIFGQCDYLPIVDGEVYLPFRSVMEELYGRKIEISFENGIISVSSDYYESFKPFSFAVGENVITIDGQNVEGGKSFIENGTTYVSKDFFENVFGWIVDYIKYDYIDGEFEYAISTSFAGYPAYSVYITTDYAPIYENCRYVPLEQAINYAYDEYYNMSNENGVVTLESRLFTEFDKVVLNVGSDIALVDGKEVSMEASAIVEDGIVYVPCEFFYNVFGWVLYDAGYDMLEKEYTICFDTSDYYYN